MLANLNKQVLETALPGVLYIYMWMMCHGMGFPPWRLWNPSITDCGME